MKDGGKEVPGGIRGIKRHQKGFLGETMVGLNPSKFYGRVLPRPRIYCDVKFSDVRVDPPEGVNAALLEWAGNAEWNRGGTSSTRKRRGGGAVTEEASQRSTKVVSMLAKPRP